MARPIETSEKNRMAEQGAARGPRIRIERTGSAASLALLDFAKAASRVESSRRREEHEPRNLATEATKNANDELQRGCESDTVAREWLARRFAALCKRDEKTSTRLVR